MLGLSGCSKGVEFKIYDASEIKPVITDDLIGGATSDEMRELFKCNYILDFDANGNQIWKIKVGKEEMKLSFNHSGILVRINYPASFNYVPYAIEDDGTYYIPKDVYIIEDNVDETKEMDIEGGNIEIGPKNLLKKPIK